MQGFDPIFDENSKVLILGSFPSVKSRELDFYYSHPRNRFWKTLGSIFDCEVSNVDEKKHLCLKHGIALWDIVVSCDVKGSLDSNIKNYKVADLSLVLDGSNVEKILCKGQKSFELTTKSYKGNLPVIKLPSTSPANTKFDYSSWLQELIIYKKQ